MREISLNVPVEPPFEMESLYLPVPPGLVEETYNKDEFVIFVGPQHGGSGHMRIIVRLKGDVITEAIPDPGYVHRGMEKLAENRLYIQNIPLFERPAIMDCANFNLGYVRAIEQALDIEVPERARYIRTILAELCRIGTHLYDAGILAVFLGHTTGFMWPFAMRELICEALMRICGARVTASYIIPGGVRNDIDRGVLEYIREVTFFIEKKARDFERVFIKNPVTIARMKDVAVISKKEAIKYGLVGPFLRASGVEYDVRAVEPYEAYDELSWDVVVGDDGDSYSRFLVRVNEITQSINIIRQAVSALRSMPEGNVISADVSGKKKKAKAKEGEEGEEGKEEKKGLDDVKGAFFRLYGRLTLPSGEYTTLTEAARGTVLYTIVSDGQSTMPYRLRLVTPGWLYLKGFMESLKGCRLADLQAVYGSFGYFPPEADR
ncbi:NADH-quinone oxidoreductase subunit D [Archaeoglobus veneficus]|uniref:NADH dehydrogenase (Quinone) n=1 Tax=Archaeoglobus veneficus (strain DSM 11195 / SNP6) TaxID=693661 RepID=F2KQC1_ARCVS|nr:NADH-quinone oxidoreductase subunit D [Archaeoglobus veneficus]AEA46554.1 NADH dehydrogenase (quinone) [Archaeoglobus veneficus SNP6]